MDLKNEMHKCVQKHIELMDKKLVFYKKYVGCPIFVRKIGDIAFDMGDDPYYLQIYTQAMMDNILIRPWFENYIGARDFKGNRLNIHFRKINEHLYEIEKVCFG